MKKTTLSPRLAQAILARPIPEKLKLEVSQILADKNQPDLTIQLMYEWKQRTLKAKLAA